MTRLLACLALAFAAGWTVPAAQTKTTAVRLGALVDGLGHTTHDVVVLIDRDTIVRVGTGDGAVPKGADVVDLRPLTGIPGLIDLHTHITYYWDGAPGTKPLDRPATPRTVDLVAKNGVRTLETGVTTVRDLGASGGLDYALRDAINAGTFVGPRLFVAGQGISAARGGGPAPDAIPALVDARVKAGSDWIKVYGSRGSFQSVETTQTLTYEQMKAAVDAAHAAGRPIAIHSYGASGVKDAVRAGADSVEHGIELDDETIADMAKRGTVWVPTIDHNRYYVDSVDEYGWKPDVVPPLQDYIEKNLESTKRAFKAGVKIGMGSDAVYSMFGQNTRELAWMIKAGMTPAQALATATTIPAALLGHAKDLGAIAPGYFADLVAVDGDPLANIDVVITKVKVVIKGGAVVVDRR
jgi:imidazolonepropionase-like amidohydrolase